MLPKLRNKYLTPLLMLFLLATPTILFAQERFKNPISANDATQVIIKGTQWLLGLVGALFTLAIIWGAIKYIISFGDEKKVGEGKQIIKYAVVGFIIVMLTLTILNTIQQFLGIQ